MAVDIEGFDIVFSAANANHARAIDQSIASMSEKVPTLSMGISDMAKALETLGKLNIDGVKKNLDAVKDSIENIDGSKLNKVFDLATAKSEGLLNSVTSLVNMLGKVDLSSFRGGGKVEVYDEKSRVTTNKNTGGESQNQEQINALIRQREAEMQRILYLQNAINQASAKQLDTEEKLRAVATDNVKEVSSIEQINSSLENKKAKIGEIESAQRRYNEAVSEEAQLQKKIDTLRKELSTSSDSMKKADRLRQELKIEEEVWGNAEKILSTERERNVVTAEYEAIKKRQADSEATRMKQLEATMKKYQAEYDKFAEYEESYGGGKGRPLSQYWQDAIQRDQKGVIAFLKAREEYQRRISANDPELGFERWSYVAPSHDGYLNELDAINKKIKEVKEQYKETVKDLDKLNQAQEIAFHAQYRDNQLKELEAKKAIIKQLTEEYGEVARAKEMAESVPEVSKRELDSAKKQQSLKQELESIDTKIGKVDELRQKEKTLAEAEESLMSAIRDKKRYEEQLGTDNGESRLAALRAEHEELTKHKADIEAKATAEQKLNEQLDSEKKALEQAKQAFDQAGGEKRLAELKSETAELEKQKSMIAQGGSPMSNAVTSALEKEKQLEQDIARFKKEATDQDAKHKELLERIVSLKEKQGSLMDMSKTKNEFQDIRTLQELIIKESKKIGVEGIGGQFQFSDSQRKQLEEQIAKIFKTSTIEAEKMIRGAVMGDGGLMSGVWGKQNDTFFANFQINEENIKRLQQERKQVTQELTQLEQQNEQAVLAKQSAERSAIATEEQLIKARENRLKIEQELAKQQPKQSEPMATPSPSQGIVIPVKVDDKTILSEIKNISDQLATLFKDIPVSLKKELDLTFFAEKAKELKKMFAGIAIPVAGQSAPKELSIDNKKIGEASKLVKDLQTAFSDLAEKIEKTGTSSSKVFENMHNSLSTLIDDIAVLQRNVNEFDAKNVKLPKPNNAQTVLPNEEYFISANKMQETVAMYEKAQQKLSRLEEEYKKVKAAEEAAAAGSIKGKITKFLLQLSEGDELRTSDVIQREINNVKRIIDSLEEEKRALRENMNEQIRKGQVSESVSQTERKATERNIAGIREEIKERKRSLQEGEGITRAEGRQQSAVDELAQAKAELKKQETSLTEQLKKQYDELLKLDKIYEKLSAREYLNSRTGGKSGDLTSQEIQLQDKINEEIQKRKALIQANTSLSTKEGQALKANYELELLRIKAENDRWIAEQQKRYESKPSTTTKKKDTTEADLEKEILALMKEKLKLTEKQRSIEQKSNVNGGVSQEEVNLYNAIVDRLNVINNELSQLASKHTTVYDNAAQKTYLDGLEMEVRLRKELDALLKASNKAEKSAEEIRIENLVKEYKSVLSQMQTIEKAQAQANKTLNDKNATQNEKDRANKILADTTQVYEQLAKRRVEIEQETDDKIVALRNKAAATMAKAEAQRLKQEQKEREQKTSADPNATIEYAKNAKSINDLNIALKNLKKVMSEAVPNEENWNALNKTYQETKKRLDDIKKSMEGVKTQTNSIIPSLQNLAMQFGLVFSVQQLNQWVKHMVEVRSEFELQNIALRSIIQNKEKADQIFAEVQQLALKSPFSIMELNKFTKQMAAYGVEADKLVGVTKQLADVSAGLGVDMGRLILAYGQVKTANYLRATEVRQFTEAGLNITQELANYFTELNGKMVTAGEVTEMITKRMVKFEDVAEVFKRVTSAGGMFYEMQEKQSEGLKGMRQRIGDAYSIMLNDIGKSNQGIIAGVLSTIRELIQNWRVVAEYIKMAARAYLLFEAYVHRAAIIKVVTNLANAWNLVTKAIQSSTAAEFIHTDAVGKQAMMWTGLGKIWSGLKTAVSGLGIAIKAAMSATVILAVVQAVLSLINYFVEAKAKADQLAESLDNIDKEVSQEFDKSAASYERLARAITDSSKTFDERNDAMSELKRTFKDILPDEYLQLSYIEQYAGHWDEAERAMKQYYDSLALEKEKAAIKEANESELKDVRKDFAKETIDALGEDFGISGGQLQSFVDNILQQMLEGSITTTEQAIDEYIRQIENYNNKSLTKEQRREIEVNLNPDRITNKNMQDLLDIAQKMGEEYDNLADRQNHYATAYEKAQAEADAMMKTQADGVKGLIERTKSGLDQINAIQSQLSQVDLEEQNEETQARKMQLQAQLNEAIQQERDLYAAIGIEMPESFEQVAATTIDIREETARAAAEIVKMFGDGVNPAVVDLYQSYQQLERVQSQLNDGTQRSQEEVARLRDIEARSINDIKAKYRQMGVSMQGDIKKVASSQQGIYTEMARVCDATRNYFKKHLAEKLFGWIKTFGTTIEQFLSSIGVEVHLVDWDKLEAEMNKVSGDLGKVMEENVTSNVQPALDANDQLLKSTLKINDKIINSDTRLVLAQGQTVNDYVKNLKTLKEENEKIISKYDKAKDKKQWLSLQDEEYNTEAKIQLLREQAKAAKEIAEAYDPTIFESKKKSGRKGTDNTEEIARKRFEFIKRANTEYEKLLKNYDAETAKAKILVDMMGEARALGVDKQFAKDLFTKASTMDTLQSVYDTFYRGIVAKYPKIAMEFQKTFNGIALDIDVKLREEDRDEIKKQMDELMGGYELAIELDKSGVDRDIVSQLFGIDTFDLSDVTEGIEKAWLDALNARAERAAKASKTEFKAYKSMEEAKAKMGEEDVKLFESQQKKISDTFAKELRAREKEYAKYLKKSYSESVNEQVSVYRQLRQLQMDADFKRDAINGNDKLDAKAKLTALQQLDAQSSKIAARMQEELQKKLNKIQWDSFKDSPLFETVLSDIEHLSTGTIDMLIKKMEDLKKTYNGLDPKIIKELTKYTEQLTKQKIKNNPFKEFGNALREIHELKKDGLTLDKLNENLISESDELTRINNEIESYNKVLAIKQQMTHVTEQDTRLMQTDTQTLERQLRVLKEQKQKKSGSGKGVDGSDETKAMDLQIKKIQEILAARRTILASNGGNIALSSQEIALLQQESKEITKQVLSLAEKKGLKEEDIEKIKAQIRSWDKLSEAQNGSVAILNEVGSAASAGFSVAEAAINSFGGSSDEVTKAMLQGFDDCIQACISLTTSIIAMGAAANAASGIIGIIASSLTAVATLFKTIFNVHEAKLEKSIKEHQIQVKKLEAEYDNLSDAISNSFSGFQLGTNTQAAIQNLERQNEQYRAMIENEKDKKDSDEEKIADWQQTIKDNLKKAQELRQQYFTELGGLGSGSDVRDAAGGFVDAWVEAFGETRNGLSGLKEEFNDFMKNIVKKQAYMKIADHWINTFGDMINASFDQYGQVNYEKLQQAMQWFTEEAMPQMDTALEDMSAFWERFGINWTGTTSNLSGLAAGIQGVTEETAQILEALLNSMRFYVADTNEQLKSILNTMNGANDENPFLKELKNQTKYLASIDKRLDSVISATKRASGSHINVFTT